MARARKQKRGNTKRAPKRAGGEVRQSTDTELCPRRAMYIARSLQYQIVNEQHPQEALPPADLTESGGPQQQVTQVAVRRSLVPLWFATWIGFGQGDRAKCGPHSSEPAMGSTLSQAFKEGGIYSRFFLEGDQPLFFSLGHCIHLIGRNRQQGCATNAELRTHRLPQCPLA